MLNLFIEQLKCTWYIITTHLEYNHIDTIKMIIYSIGHCLLLLFLKEPLRYDILDFKSLKRRNNSLMTIDKQ